MKTIEASTIIHSSPERIWHILMDFERYHEWNPFIKYIDGEPKKGNQLTVRIQSEGMKSQEFTPEILQCRKNSEFRWLGKLFVKGLFDGEHYFLLKTIDNERVEFIHGESFKGLLTTVIIKMIGTQTLEGFKAMNRSLKQQAESSQKTSIQPN